MYTESYRKNQLNVSRVAAALGSLLGLETPLAEQKLLGRNL